MVNTCVMWGCTNRSNKGDVKRHYYDLPKVITKEGPQTEKLTSERRVLWLARINRANFNPDPTKRHYKVCSDHFISGKKTDLYDSLNPDWPPSLKLGPPSARPETPNSAVKRYQRTQGRQEKRARHSAASALLDLQSEVEPYSVSFTLRGQLEPQLIDPQELQEEILVKMKTELQTVLNENHELKEKLRKSELTPDSLKNDVNKVKHYTGRTFTTLMAVFQLLCPVIPHSSKSVLTQFEKVMLVLMKLRLNLSCQDLAFRFKVSTSCVSKTFKDIINCMYFRMKCFILWTEREELRLTMPMEFRKHFGVRVSIIIDCFEIFIERPSNLRARAETWSNYKHHNTVKYLIGITPQGAVSFLSKGWGGRTSDKRITENCFCFCLCSSTRQILIN